MTEESLPEAEPNAHENIDSRPREIILAEKQRLLGELSKETHDLKGWLGLLKRPEYAPIVTCFHYEEGNEIRFQNVGSWTMHKFPSEGTELENFLKQKGLVDFELVNTGDKSLVLGCDVKFASPPYRRPVVVRIRHIDSESTPRAHYPFVLQPYAAQAIGKLVYVEILPRVKTKGVERKHVEDLKRVSKEMGDEWGDGFDYNAGLLPNGAPVIIDGGHLHPQWAKKTADPTGPWIKEDGTWLQNFFFPGLRAGWEQIQGQYIGPASSHERRI